MSSPDVAIRIDSSLGYSTRCPFHPPEAFPELGSLGKIQDSENRLYRQVRQCLQDLGLDSANANTHQWNPLGDIIRPGDRVLIKPNLVLHYHERGEDPATLVSQASIIRPLIDYALVALDGKGTVVIGDAPHGDADFSEIVERNGLKELVDWYRQQGQPVSLVDFRRYVYGMGPGGFVEGICREVSYDPLGYQLVDLKEKSFLVDLPHLERLYGSDYNRKFIVSQHTNGHRYLISKSVLESDVIISVPKLKTHKKTGVTINLKNLVGINGDKNYLAHYRVGSPRQGGDEYPDLSSKIECLLKWWEHWANDHLLAKNTLFFRRVFALLNRPFRRIRYWYKLATKADPVELGNWHGNDTTWRMCLDLNQILFYADKEGTLHSTPQRRYFSLVDGVVAGEGDGPMAPIPRNIGMIACGRDPFAVDYICSWQLGFDPSKLMFLAFPHRFPGVTNGYDSLRVDCTIGTEKVDYREINWHFQPHRHWKGYLERHDDASDLK